MEESNTLKVVGGYKRKEEEEMLKDVWKDEGSCHVI